MLQSNLLLALAVMLLTACSSIPINERVAVREEMNQYSEQSLKVFLASRPELQAEFDASHGYFLGKISGAVLGVGAGTGSGILYNTEKNTRTYMDISRLDLGWGIGVGQSQLLVLFKTDDARDNFGEGDWFSGIGTTAAAGSTSDLNASATGVYDEDTTFYYLTESGVGIAATARVVSLSVNEDLTDTGVSDVSMPNKNFEIANQQTDGAPRQWEHELPFFAQNVIDKGYNLPLPYGISLIYADVEQDFKMNSMDVGFNGGDKQRFDFVDFKDASTRTSTFQLKADAWLLPFMNVFAMVGRVEGEAPLTVALDGNGVLDHLNVDCSGRLPPPTCRLFEDKNVEIPIEIAVGGTTYGFGTTLVGGWHNYFATLPISFTFTEMDGKEIEGYTMTIMPRAGRVFNLQGMGSLALFVGGSYLQADLTIISSISCETRDFECVGNEPFSLDYTIKQSNSDRWNMLVGGNWDLNKHWSWHAEYGGFIGSRDAIISSLSYRY